MKLQLIPFDPRFAEAVLPYYIDQDYSHWARGMRRYLTLEECRHLPEFFRTEFLHIISDESKLIGLIQVEDKYNGVFSLSVVINKNLIGHKLGHKCMDISEEYLEKKKGARMIMAEFLKKDFWLGEAVTKRNWLKIGEIPQYHFVDGKYEDVEIYYKKVS